MNVTAIPEEVKSVTVSFSPPEEPNGIITDYVALVYEKEKLIKNISLRIIQTENNTLTADVEGLKGGHNYSIQVKSMQKQAITQLYKSLSYWNLLFLVLV